MILMRPTKEAKQTNKQNQKQHGYGFSKPVAAMRRTWQACLLAIIVALPAAPLMLADAPRMVMMGDVVVTNAEMIPYVSRMKQKIKKIWQKPREVSERLKVLFEIDRSGSIHHLRVGTSCGDRHLDNKALQAVRQAAPFGSLPGAVETPFQAEYLF